MLRIIAKALLIFTLCLIGVSCSKEKISTKDSRVYVEQVKVSPPEASLLVAESCKLTVKITPSNATNKKVRWSSSTPSVATVDANGNVSAIGIGTATITATSAMVEGKTGNCVVTVVPTPIPTTGVSIDQAGEQMVKVGGKIQLTCSLKPSNTTYHQVRWTSNNKSVATVDENGKVTGVARGTATISVITENGNHIASVKVRVVQAYTSVKVTSPSTSDSNYNKTDKYFRYMEGDTFQIQVSTVPAEAEDSLIFKLDYDSGYTYLNVSPQGLVTFKQYSSNTYTIWVFSAADDAVYDRIPVRCFPKPTGITLSVYEIPGAEVQYKKRERDSWDIGIGATHKYMVNVKPDNAPQDVSIAAQMKMEGGCSFDLEGNILTVSVSSDWNAPTGPSAANRTSTVLLAAKGDVKVAFDFYCQKLDPYKAKEGDCLAKDHVGLVGIEDGGYRGNGRYDTKGCKVSTGYLIGSHQEDYRHSIIMWIGDDHLTDDPLWSKYGPTKSIVANGKAIHGIAVPKNANQIHRSSATDGEIWQDSHTFIVDNSDLPAYYRSNKALLQNTSNKHSALFNTCAHVGANAGNGSSYEVRPAQFFVNALTKQPSTDNGVDCSDGKYWSLSNFGGTIAATSVSSELKDYTSPWLFPTLIDMCCVFVGRQFSASSLTAADKADAAYRLALLKNRVGINDWNLTWWVSQETDKDNAVQFRAQPDNSDKPVTYNFSRNKSSDSAKAFVYPIIYF